MDRTQTHTPPPWLLPEPKRAGRAAQSWPVVRSVLFGLFVLLGLARSGRAETRPAPQVLFYGITRVEPAAAEGAPPVHKLDRALTGEVRRQLGADGGVSLLSDPCAADDLFCQTIGEAAMRAHAASSPQRPEILLRGQNERWRQA